MKFSKAEALSRDNLDVTDRRVDVSSAWRHGTRTNTPFMASVWRTQRFKGTGKRI
jgi:hypothetical protein